VVFTIWKQLFAGSSNGPFHVRRFNHGWGREERRGREALGGLLSYFFLGEPFRETP